MTTAQSVSQVQSVTQAKSVAQAEAASLVDDEAAEVEEPPAGAELEALSLEEPEEASEDVLGEVVAESDPPADEPEAASAPWLRVPPVPELCESVE